MPPEHIAGSPENWLARARSSLSLAKVKKPPECLWEDLCFHAQQAVEKALKAVLVHQGIAFRLVHDVNELLQSLEEHGIHIPERLREATTLTGFAVMTRYPGAYEPVSAEEHGEAVRLADEVLAWVTSIITAAEAEERSPTKDRNASRSAEQDQGHPAT